MGDNDLLLLKTRVLKGLVSFCVDDLEMLYPGPQVPEYILKDLQREVSNGRLFIISDEKGNLRARCTVQSGVANRLVGVRNKALAFLTSNAFKTTLDLEITHEVTCICGFQESWPYLSIAAP